MSGHCQYRWEELSGDIAASCTKLAGVAGGREGRGKVEIGRTFDSFSLGHIIHIKTISSQIALSGPKGSVTSS